MITFGEPWLLVGLVIPIVIAGVLWYAARRIDAVGRRLGGPPRLRPGPGAPRVLAVLLTLAAALAIVAAARPQWGEGDEQIAQRGIDLVIALDVSRSMEAQDIAPSRARAAADGLEAMLEHMTGNRVGLVVFAGDAFLRAPLTVDLEVVSSLVARAQAEAPLVDAGTDFRAALAEAFRALDVDDRAATQAILLVSDGEHLNSAYQDAVDFAERRGIRIYTVFAATTAPTALPGDSAGAQLSVGQPDPLEAIASATDGVAREVERIPGLAVEFRRLQQTQFGEATETRPIDRFTWFAGAAALALLLVSLVGEGTGSGRPRLRNGVITGLLGLLALLFAGCGTPEWTHVHAGNEAFAAERYEEALAEYRQAAETLPESAAVQYNIANALHRLGRFDEAAATAAEARRLAVESGDGGVAAQALFTLGNSAYLRRDFEAARDAYQAALRLVPDDRAAKENLELVLARLTPPDPPAPPGSPQEGPPQGPEGTPAGGASGQDSQGEGGGTPAAPGGPGTPAPAPDNQPTPPADGQPSQGGPSSPGTPSGGGAPSPGAGAEAITLEEAREALRNALGQLGPEVTLEEALRILELARQANELEELPGRPEGGVPPR